MFVLLILLEIGALLLCFFRHVHLCRSGVVSVGVSVEVGVNFVSLRLAQP